MNECRQLAVAAFVIDFAIAIVVFVIGAKIGFFWFGLVDLFAGDGVVLAECQAFGALSFEACHLACLVSFWISFIDAAVAVVVFAIAQFGSRRNIPPTRRPLRIEATLDTCLTGAGAFVCTVGLCAPCVGSKTRAG
jgi:hypothetical protein